MTVEHSKEDESELIYCPENASDIKENEETNTLYCMVDYEDYDYVFTAKNISKMEMIK